jgi:hypothetical protein
MILILNHHQQRIYIYLILKNNKGYIDERTEKLHVVYRFLFFLHSAFAFEVLFKYFRELFHGTRGLVNQACDYYLLDKYNYFQYSSLYKNSHHIKLNLFVIQLLTGVKL